MQTGNTPSENAILQKVENALEQAVLELDLEWHNPRIKRQKYSYLAVDHYTEDGEYPLTYSWFRWGTSFIGAPAAEDGFGGQHTLYSQDARDSQIFSVNVNDLVHFFKHELDHLPLQEYWQAGLYDFLDPFYTNYAPEEYQQLYLANTALQRILDDVKESFSNGGQPVNTALYEDVGRATANLQIGLMDNEELKQIVDPVVNFTDVMEDVMLSFTNFSPEDISQQHLQALIELKSFYTTTVWGMPASILSQQTAVGPNRDRIIRWAEAGLEQHRTDYAQGMKGVIDFCRSADLLTDPADYPGYDDELEASMNALLETVDGQHE